MNGKTPRSGAASRPMAGQGLDSYNSGGVGGYTPPAMGSSVTKYSPADWSASNMSHYNR